MGGCLFFGQNNEVFFWKFHGIPSQVELEHHGFWEESLKDFVTATI